MDIGIVTIMRKGVNSMEKVSAFGLKVCQLIGWNPEFCTEEMAEKIIQDSREHGIRIGAMWGWGAGPGKFNFTEGPVTLGLVPEAYREERVQTLKNWADFAQRIGAPALVTHCGFIPENATDPGYPGVVEAIRDVAGYCRSKGLGFWFETGQETPVVLLRTIERVGEENLGINLDPANLILYGKGNPIDALDVIGPYVRCVHVKDGLYPTNGDELGKEVLTGTGRVRFPEFLKKLRSMGYDGDLIIEREITGEQQERDIRTTIDNLHRWLA
ncbi:sugar phosphate isomerase/epimerase family protein [Paenibacillus aurantius]|uniref:Sugar phosphate isomerase/epimerase family protein n=1 Tax=Paenibacillus aurantius TaxID=2918900 RepID=A0AA96RDE4_9BACL|nr:sugar phosphate isomerase/epimerase family protein [Paenibacillus aurantius]WNQ08998.1 sugar phosphate isomerase/epimerase family protein [Paenibacillus aurantius]